MNENTIKKLRQYQIYLTFIWHIHVSDVLEQCNETEIEFVLRRTIKLHHGSQNL